MDTTEQTLTPEQQKWTTHEFVTPKKEIVTEMDIAKLKNSAFYGKYIQFLVDLQKSIESKKISDTPQNPKFAKLVAWLDQLEQYINEVPPLQQKMRFGNTAYRTWHEKVQQVSLIDRHCSLIVFNRILTANWRIFYLRI